MGTKMKTKKQMVEFLKNHFRYYTMNSWNLSTSYAANVKIRNFVPSNLMEAAYDILECEDAYDDINDIIQQFGIRHNWKYHIWFNGRSDGYLVLGKGGADSKVIYTDAEFEAKENYGGRVYADGYGWKSRDEAKRDGVYNRTLLKRFTNPGMNLDMGEDFSGWDLCSLKERVALVKDFDETVEACKKAFLETCGYGVREETVYEPKTVKVLNR